MIKGINLLLAFALTCGVVCAQNSNSSTTTTQRPRTNTNRTKPVTTETQEQPAAPKQAAPKKPATTGQKAPGSNSVTAAFNALIDGIKHANVDEVMSVYLNNPRLSLFNYNGTVTKGWEQVRKNRESSYPEIKDVKLDIRDVSVRMLGSNAAVVT